MVLTMLFVAHDTISTTKNDLNSPFLRLPAEMRNRIYIYVLASKQPLTFTCSKPHFRYESPWNNVGQFTNVKCIMSRRTRLNLALLSVCRRIYFEVSLLQFILNTVRCISLQVLAQLPSLLSAEQRSVIRVLHLVTVIGQRRKLNKLVDPHDAWNATFEALLPGVREIVVELGEHPFFDMASEVRGYMDGLGEWLKGRNGDGDRVKITWAEPWDYCADTAV
jgi:hypothetical protein